MSAHKLSIVSQAATLSAVTLLLAACGGGATSGDVQESPNATIATVSDSEVPLAEAERWKRRTVSTVTTSSPSATSTATASAATAPTTTANAATASTTTTPSTAVSTTTTGTPSPSWTVCAQEDGVCSFSGTHNVRYGVGSTYATKAFTSSAACNNATFGDPAVGIMKACSYDASDLPATAVATAKPVATTTPTVPTPAATTPAPAATTPATGVLAGAEWTGVSAAMWSEINAQRGSFGDSNDCQARVASVPTSGGVTLQPGADINAALYANSVVFLASGTYTPSGRIGIPAGKKLIGLPGATVTLNMVNADIGVEMQSNSVLANVIVDSAQLQGVNIYNYTGALVHRVSVRRTGLNANGNTGGGIFVSGGSAYNCVVSAEASDTWNVSGSPNDHGGNADGINNTWGAHDNTFIDVHSYRNGDDNIDMWRGGVAFFYFAAAHDAGKAAGKGSLQGNGNGIKLGGAGDAVAHKLYKTTSTNNTTGGIDINGNAVQPVLVQTTASGNGTSNFIGIAGK